MSLACGSKQTNWFWQTDCFVLVAWLVFVIAACCCLVLDGFVSVCMCVCVCVCACVRGLVGGGEGNNSKNSHESTILICMGRKKTTFFVVVLLTVSHWLSNMNVFGWQGVKIQSALARLQRYRISCCLTGAAVFLACCTRDFLCCVGVHSACTSEFCSVWDKKRILKVYWLRAFVLEGFWKCTDLWRLS